MLGPVCHHHEALIASAAEVDVDAEGLDDLGGLRVLARPPAVMGLGAPTSP